MKKLLYFMLAASLFCACDNGNGQGNDNPEEPKTYSVTAEPSTFTVDAAGATLSSKITCSGADSWSLSGASASWCKASATSGKSGDTLTFTVEPSEDTAERNVTYTLTCGTASQKVLITQKQKDAILVSSAKVEVPAAGNSELEVVVQTNVEVEVAVAADAAAWITHVATRALQNATFVLKIEPNDSTAGREGVVTVKGGGASEDIHIYQSGEAVQLVLNGKKNFTIPATGGDCDVDGSELLFEVSSNVDVEVAVQTASGDGDWLKQVTGRSMSTQTFRFTAEENDTNHVRNAKIVFRTKSGNLSETVSVSQQRYDDWGKGDGENEDIVPGEPIE